METVITFTPSELVGFLGTIAGVVSAIGLLVTYAIKVTKRMKAPMEELKREITSLKRENEARKKENEEQQKKNAELERRLGDGDKRFGKVEESTIIMLETLRALLEHSLGGNDSELETAKANLDKYLSRSLFKVNQSE